MTETREARIAVLGSGTWGIALARVLFLNGHSVTVWSKFPEEAGLLDRTREAKNLPGVHIPEGIRFTADPAEAAEGADYLLMAVPSILMPSKAMVSAPRPHPSSSMAEPIRWTSETPLGAKASGPT